MRIASLVIEEASDGDPHLVVSFPSHVFPVDDVLDFQVVNYDVLSAKVRERSLVNCWYHDASFLDEKKGGEEPDKTPRPDYLSVNRI